MSHTAETKQTLDELLVTYLSVFTGLYMYHQCHCIQLLIRFHSLATAYMFYLVCFPIRPCYPFMTLWTQEPCGNYDSMHNTTLQMTHSNTSIQTPGPIICRQPWIGQLFSATDFMFRCFKMLIKWHSNARTNDHIVLFGWREQRPHDLKHNTKTMSCHGERTWIWDEFLWNVIHCCNAPGYLWSYYRFKISIDC